MMEEVRFEKDEILMTEEFAYMAAVAIHCLCEHVGPFTIEKIMKDNGFPEDDIRPVIDEAYRRRLGM